MACVVNGNTIDLVDSYAEDQITFHIAGMYGHSVTTDGVSFRFGRMVDGNVVTDDDSLQEICDAFAAVREFERQFGYQPIGADPNTPTTVYTPNRTVKLFTDNELIVNIADNIITYKYTEANPSMGIPTDGGWLFSFNGLGGCGRDTPQQYADLCDTVVDWIETYCGITPTPPFNPDDE